MWVNDASGKRLIEEWYQVSKEVFYNSSYFYITALSHCYPGKTSSGNDKLPPKYCTNKWLLKELKAVNNKIYIIIGAKSANYFFPGEQFNRLVYNDQQINNKPAFVIPHPSPLNNRWFKKNPAFFDGRIQQIRKQLWKAIE
jgi:uracil-DNA glycosylase